MHLTQGLHHAVRQTPDQPMTIYGGRELTFRQVAGRVARLAGALRGLGVTSGDRVAFLGLNCDRYSEYLLAVPWADGVLNPVNICWSPAEIAYVLEDSGTAVLFVDDTFAPMVPTLRRQAPGLHTVIHCGEGPTPQGVLSYEDLVSDSQPISDASRGGDAPAGIFYTSGMTGFPEGAMLSHANLITAALGAMATGYLLAPRARLLHAAPMFHPAALVTWTTQVLLGGTHVIIPAFEPIAVMKAIQAHRVTDVLLTPTMVQMLVDHPHLAAHDLSSLTRLLCGVSPIPAALLDRTSKALPQASFIHAYGTSETATVATV